MSKPIKLVGKRQKNNLQNTQSILSQNTIKQTQRDLIQQISFWKNKIFIYQTIDQQIEELNQKIKVKSKQQSYSQDQNQAKHINVNKKIKVYELKKKFNKLNSQYNTKLNSQKIQSQQLLEIIKSIQNAQQQIQKQKERQENFIQVQKKLQDNKFQKQQLINELKKRLKQSSNYQRLLVLDEQQLKCQINKKTEEAINKNSMFNFKYQKFPQEEQFKQKIVTLNHSKDQYIHNYKGVVEKRFQLQKNWRMTTTTSKHKNTTLDLLKKNIQSYQVLIDELKIALNQQSTISEKLGVQLSNLVGVRGQIRGILGVRLQQIQIMKKINSLLQKDLKLISMNSNYLKNWEKQNLSKI